MLLQLKALNMNLVLGPIRAFLKIIVIAYYGLAAPSALAVDDALEARIKSMVEEMSLEQKVGQMVQGEIKWVTPADVTKYHLGSVLNGGGSFPEGNKLATMNDWLKLPTAIIPPHWTGLRVERVFLLSGVLTLCMVITM